MQTAQVPIVTEQQRISFASVVEAGWDKGTLETTGEKFGFNRDIDYSYILNYTTTNVFALERLFNQEWVDNHYEFVWRFEELRALVSEYMDFTTFEPRTDITAQVTIQGSLIDMPLNDPDSEGRAATRLCDAMACHGRLMNMESHTCRSACSFSISHAPDGQPLGPLDANGNVLVAEDNPKIRNNNCVTLIHFIKKFSIPHPPYGEQTDRLYALIEPCFQFAERVFEANIVEQAAAKLAAAPASSELEPSKVDKPTEPEPPKVETPKPVKANPELTKALDALETKSDGFTMPGIFSALVASLKKAGIKESGISRAVNAANKKATTSQELNTLLYNKLAGIIKRNKVKHKETLRILNDAHAFVKGEKLDTQETIKNPDPPKVDHPATKETIDTLKKLTGQPEGAPVAQVIPVAVEEKIPSKIKEDKSPRNERTFIGACQLIFDASENNQKAIAGLVQGMTNFVNSLAAIMVNQAGVDPRSVTADVPKKRKKTKTKKKGGKKAGKKRSKKKR